MFEGHLDSPRICGAEAPRRRGVDANLRCQRLAGVPGHPSSPRITALRRSRGSPFFADFRGVAGSSKIGSYDPARPDQALIIHLIGIEGRVSGVLQSERVAGDCGYETSQLLVGRFVG